MAKLKSINLCWLNGISDHRFIIEMKEAEIEQILNAFDHYSNTDKLVKELKEILEKNK